MNLPILLVRAAAMRALALFDPPQPLRTRAAYLDAGLESRTVTGNAGPHGRDRRR